MPIFVKNYLKNYLISLFSSWSLHRKLQIITLQLIDSGHLIGWKKIIKSGCKAAFLQARSNKGTTNLPEKNLEIYAFKKMQSYHPIV